MAGEGCLLCCAPGGGDDILILIVSTSLNRRNAREILDVVE